jgi:hypothetical protein
VVDAVGVADPAQVAPDDERAPEATMDAHVVDDEVAESIGGDALADP